MSEHTAPTPPQPPDTTHRAPKRRRWPWVIAVLAALFVGYGIGAAGGEDTPTADAPVASAEPADDTTSEPPAKPKPEPEPEPTFYEPTVDDYALTIKTLEKQCFGSAGCNIDFRIEVTSLYTEPVDPTVTYELTYEVRGGEDPLLNTLTITGDQYETEESEFIGTASSDAELSAVVIDVSKRGL